MNKVLLCNLDLLRKRFPAYEPETLDHFELRNEFIACLDEYILEGENEAVFFSRDSGLLDKATESFGEKNGYYFANRSIVRNYIKDNYDEKSSFVIISGKDVDFQIAANYKLLHIIPAWIPCEEKAMKYGIVADTPGHLFRLLETLNNHNAWYSSCQVDDKTVVLSLIDARYKYHARSTDERIVVENFERLLKTGSGRNYYEILLYHFLAGMTGSSRFDDVELFGMVPSSNCCLNPDVFSFMKQVRFIKGKRLPHNTMQCENLVIRTQEKQTAHNVSSLLRQKAGPEVEFQTLIVNPEYRDKIEKLKKQKRLNICVFDDYTTYGNSFNAIRNIFNHLGADKMIFESLGHFGHAFAKWDYNIEGNVYEPGYNYELIRKQRVYPVYNDDAKTEVAELYSIFNQSSETEGIE